MAISQTQDSSQPDAGSLGNQTEVPQTPAQPAQPAAQPAAPSAQPQASQAQPAAQPAAKPAAPPTPKSLHASIYEGVLKTLGGGPIMVDKTDPATGATTREEVPQTKGQLGKSILAGALAGMFGGMGARDAEGRHDPGKAAQQGFQATTDMRDKRQAAFQQAADKDTASRQMAMKNNLDLMHQQIAMTAQNHAVLADTIADNEKGILASAAEFDKNLPATDVNDLTKKAIQASGLTHDQALAKLNGHWSDQLAIVDGQRSTRNPVTGVMEVEPLYTLLNPNVKVKMSEEQAKEFARYKPAYQNAYQDTNGNLQMSLNNYAADTHLYNSLQHGEASLDRVKEALGSEGVDLAALVRDPKTSQAVKSAVLDMENATAQGGDISAILQRLQGTGGGALILKDMKIDDEDINKYNRSQESAEALAKQGGMGEKAPAAQENLDSTNALIGELQDPKMRKDFQNQIHPNMSNKQLTDVNKELRTQLDADRTYNAANPAAENPQGLVGEKYIATRPVGEQNMLRMYGEGRAELSARVMATKQGQALAEKIGLAYPGYDPTKAHSYAQLRTDITSGKDSQGISRGNAAINHAGLFFDHISNWSTVYGVKTLNKWAAGDAAKLELDREAVASELAGAYKGGSAAPTKDEIQDWRNRLNGGTAPILKVQIQEALRLVREKVTTYDDKWASTAPTRVPVPSNVFSQESRKTYSRVTGEQLSPRVDDVVTVKGQKMRIVSIGEDGTAQTVNVGGK